MPDFKDRLEHLMKMYNLTQSQLAKSIGVAQPSISSLLNGKTGPSIDLIRKLSENYSLSYNWLIAGDGETSKPLMVAEPQVHYGSRTVWCPISANAGFTGAYTQEWINQSPKYVSIPGFTTADRLIEVEGKSMEPLFHDGDYAICHIIDDKAFRPRQERAYVIETISSGILLKYLQLTEIGYDLISANTRYPKQAILTSEIKSIWSVAGKITQTLVSPEHEYLLKFSKNPTVEVNA